MVDTYIKELKILDYQLKAIRIHYSSLLEAVHEPKHLATRLFSKGLLDSLVLKNVTSSGVYHTDQVCAILDSVISQISLNHKAYDKFLQVLKDEPSTSVVAQHIQTTFGKLYKHHTFNFHSDA